MTEEEKMRMMFVLIESYERLVQKLSVSGMRGDPQARKKIDELNTRISVQLDMCGLKRDGGRLMWKDDKG